MKILIDTDWFAAIQDLPSKKQKEVLMAILSYPNGHSDTHLWKDTILPNLEKGKISYLNRINNLKQNRCKAQELGEKNTDSVSDSTIKEKESNNIYNNINNNTGVINNRGLGEERKGGESDPQINPPTLEEVIAEANLQNSMAGVGGYKISPEVAEEFYTTYAPSNWRIHNEHETPIRDWKVMLRGWAIKKRKEKLAESEKDGIPIAPKPFRDDSKNTKK